jgi:hypothetical protein
MTSSLSSGARAMCPRYTQDDRPHFAREINLIFFLKQLKRNGELEFVENQMVVAMKSTGQERV